MRQRHQLGFTLASLLLASGCGFFEAHHGASDTDSNAITGRNDESDASDATVTIDTTPDAGGVSGAAGRGSAGSAAKPPPDAGRIDAGVIIDSGAPPCDESASPRDEPCLIDDRFSAFVAQSGGPKTDATLAAPAATLAQGLAAAHAHGVSRVLICDGDYDDSLVLDGVQDAIAIYGGFDCRGQGAWKPSKTGVTRIAPATGVALHVIDSSAAIEIEHIELDARAATDPGASSLVAIVEKSAHLTLREVTLRAGTGARGADGVLRPFTYPLLDTCDDSATDAMCLAGKPASASDGGARRNFTCPASDQTFGGGGGDGGPKPQSGEDGFPDLGMGAGGPGGSPCTGGTNGAPGAAGQDGAGAATYGDVQMSTWQPTDGASGTAGAVGQGGGGGGATAKGGGGGGGAGGCGGAAGDGGHGGGASIALISIASQITLQGCKLIAADAGRGGAGAAAQLGQPKGGSGGSGAQNACGGGNGGAGGDGGAGGGGAGGISAGIVYRGSAPQVDKGTTITIGHAGTAGPGGRAGVNDGVAGVAKAKMEME